MESRPDISYNESDAPARGVVKNTPISVFCLVAFYAHAQSGSASSRADGFRAALYVESASAGASRIPQDKSLTS